MKIKPSVVEYAIEGFFEPVYIKIIEIDFKLQSLRLKKKYKKIGK